MGDRLLGLLVVVGLPLFAGASTLRCIGVWVQQSPIARLVASWLVGSLLVAALMFVGLLVGLPKHRLVVPSCLAIGAVGLAVGSWRQRPSGDLRHAGGAPVTRAPSPSRRWRPWFVGFAVAAALTPFIARCAIVNTKPVVYGDEAHIWAAKAKLLYTAGGFNAAVDERLRWAASTLHDVEHPDYPLLNPLLQVWTFTVLGEVSFCDARIPIQCFGAALVLAVMASVARRSGWWMAFAAGSVAAALLQTRLDAHHAAADAMVGVGAVVAVDAWWNYYESHHRSWWRFACLATAFLLWTKHEAVLISASLVLSAAIGCLFRRIDFRRLLAPTRAGWGWLLVPLVGPATTAWFMQRYGLSNDLLGSQHALLGTLIERFAERVPTVARHFGTAMITSWDETFLIYPMWMLAVVANARRSMTGSSFVVVCTIVLSTLAIGAVFIGTRHDLVWHLDTAAGRVWSQLSGVMLVHAGALLAAMADE